MRGVNHRARVGLQDRLFIALIVLAMLGSVAMNAVLVLPRGCARRGGRCLPAARRRKRTGGGRVLRERDDVGPKKQIFGASSQDPMVMTL